MSHTPDQDLLLLAHHSLNPFKAMAARIHLSRCANCRRRFGEFSSVSTAVAAAIRPGLSPWKPAALGALKLKIMLSVLVIGAVCLWGRVMVDADPPYVTSPAASGVDSCNVIQHSGPPLSISKIKPTIKAKAVPVAK